MTFDHIFVIMTFGDLSSYIRHQLLARGKLLAKVIQCHIFVIYSPYMVFIFVINKVGVELFVSAIPKFVEIFLKNMPL